MHGASLSLNQQPRLRLKRAILSAKIPVLPSRIRKAPVYTATVISLRLEQPFQVVSVAAETLGRMADPFYAHRGFVSRTRQFLKLFSRIHMIFSIARIGMGAAAYHYKAQYEKRLQWL
jgi:hypothetical protein